MDDHGRSVLERSLDDSVRNATPVGGGFSGARCWRVVLGDGRSVFVKLGEGDDAIAGNVAEATVLSEVRSRHLPSLVGLFDSGRMLVVEDLGGADWSGWADRGVDGLWAAIADIGSHEGPPSLGQAFQGAGRDPWAAVVSDPRFAPAVGIERGWIDRWGGLLGATSTSANTSGNRLVHGDLAPGNWCVDTRGVWRVVDWAAAIRGHPMLDVVTASIRLTRTSASMLPVCAAHIGDHPEFVAFVAGRFAGELLDVDWSTAPPRARSDRIADIRAGMVLAAHLLDLPSPVFGVARVVP